MRNRTLLSKKNTTNIVFFLIALVVFLYSCKDKEIEKNEYEPNRPIGFTSFYPDSGGMMSQVILNGSNFGSDKSKVKVYFNKKQALVTGLILVSNSKGANTGQHSVAYNLSKPTEISGFYPDSEWLCNPFFLTVM